jgi:hypothetical protein
MQAAGFVTPSFLPIVRSTYPLAFVTVERAFHLLWKKRSALAENPLGKKFVKTKKPSGTETKTIHQETIAEIATMVLLRHHRTLQLQMKVESNLLPVLFLVLPFL